MIKTIILISMILSISIFGFGQRNKESDAEFWQIKLGYQNFRILDRNVSPLIYSANNGIVGFQYEKIKSNNLWNIGGSLSIGSNQSKKFGYREAVVYDHYSIHGNRDSSIYTINPKLSFIQGSFSYAYYWKLDNQHNDIHLGGQLIDNFVYGALGADVWFYNLLSVLPSFKMNLFDESKSELNAIISTPIFSYILRQPYTLDPSLPESSYLKAYLKTGSTIATVNKFQQVNLELNYYFILQTGNKIGLSYDFMWMNYANFSERNLRAYSNSLLISYTF